MSAEAKTAGVVAAAMPDIDIDYARATRRLYHFTVAIGICGLPVASWRLGWPGAAGWLLGVAISLLNLWLWERVATKLSSRGEQKKGPGTATLALRALAVLAAAYVIVNTLKVNGMALVCGLLASVLGVIAEIVLELASPLAARWK
jgi:hypothetical protein